MKLFNHGIRSKIMLFLVLSIANFQLLWGQGYLNETTLPNSLTILDPPPAKGSSAFALDVDLATNYFPFVSQELKDQAYRDASTDFEKNQPFKEILGFEITPTGTPAMYTLILRSLYDANASTNMAKNHYKRIRPFVYFNNSSCTPEDEAAMRGNFSYPSGHAALGWTYALILTELFSEKSDAILARGKAFGTSRNICNAHWYSDVLAGRLMGSATLARLHAFKGWQMDYAKARKEVSTMKGGR